MEKRDSGNGAKAHPVGAAVSLNQADRAKLFAVEHEIRALLGKLGQLRETYLKEDARLLAEVGALRSAYRQGAVQMGASYGVKQGSEQWDFNADEMTFTRVR